MFVKKIELDKMRRSKQNNGTASTLEESVQVAELKVWLHRKSAFGRTPTLVPAQAMLTLEPELHQTGGAASAAMADEPKPFSALHAGAAKTSSA